MRHTSIKQKIAVEASVVTEREATEWLSELDILNQRGQFFSSLTIDCVKGHKKWKTIDISKETHNHISES